MPLDSTYADTVAFILGDRRREGMTMRDPIGTGFFVKLPSAAKQQGFFLYLITAAHVVATERATGVRFNRTDGGVADFDIPQWYLHPTEDVAAAPVATPIGLRVRYIPDDAFIDRWDKQPSLGDPVYFIGLLSGIPAMAQSNVPMTRGGILGRMNQQGVPVRYPDNTIRHINAHLIDCRSYAGFSGSPCFVQSQVTRRVDTPSIPGGAIGNLVFQETVLLGLISGHFDQWERAKITGDILGTVEAPVSTGVGIVTPAEAIRQLLDEDLDLVGFRAAHDARARLESAREIRNADRWSGKPSDPSTNQIDGFLASGM